MFVLHARFRNSLMTYVNARAFGNKPIVVRALVVFSNATEGFYIFIARLNLIAAARNLERRTTAAPTKRATFATLIAPDAYAARSSEQNAYLKIREVHYSSPFLRLIVSKIFRANSHAAD